MGGYRLNVQIECTAKTCFRLTSWSTALTHSIFENIAYFSGIETSQAITGSTLCGNKTTGNRSEE